MKGPALIVPRSEGEERRRALRAAGLLRTDLAIRSEGEMLLLPIVASAPVPADWGSCAEREFEAVPPPGPRDYRELLGWPAEQKARLPRSFDVVGDIVLVRLPRGLEDRGAEIGGALLRFVPGARVVGSDQGVHGPERRRSIERLAGNGGWATRHRENGVELDVDVERAYFSPRLAGEHARVAHDVGSGDRVYDLCAGVGPFSVAIARAGRAREIFAVDANPVAVELLRRTLARYPFGGRVTPVASRLEEFLPRREPADRVILNLPREGIKYLPSVNAAVAPGGRLYYYEVVPRAERAGRAEMIRSSLGSAAQWAVVATRVVHPYSPRSDLMGFTFERAPL
jgi:tRNA (guanine37-N1)-methyltransferase